MFLNNIEKIIIVRNIIFKNFYKRRYILTPNKHLIRTCLIINELEDKRCILPISSSESNKNHQHKKFKINNENLMLNTLTTENCYIELDQIISIEPYYREPVDELEKMQDYKCLLKLKEFYEHINYKYEEYELVKQDVNKQLKKLKPKCKLSIYFFFCYN